MDYSQIAIGNIMMELKGGNKIEVDVPLVRHMILNTIRANRFKFFNEYGNVVIACDGRNYWRKTEFPYYKANRKKSRDNSTLNWDQLFEALNTVKEELKEYFPYPVIDIDRAEADDVIATLAEWSSENDFDNHGLDFGPQPLLIVSGDHDFVQLQKYSHVQQWNPVKKKFVRPERPIELVVKEHIFRGDDGDGVPNFLSDDDVFVTEGKRQKSIYQVKLDEWLKEPLENWKDTPEWKNIQRNQKLVDLTFVPQDIKDLIVDKYLTTRDGRDRSKLMSYFMKNKMSVMMQHIGEF